MSEANTPVSESKPVRATMTDSEKERTKLLANALDRASTASLAIGVFTPIASTMYGTSTNPYRTSSLDVYAAALSWLLLAVILHLFAHAVLRRLR
jgi:Na+/melibiose symporter-like transporter